MIIGIIGLFDSFPKNKKEGTSFSGKYVFGSIGLLAIGVILILKELLTLF